MINNRQQVFEIAHSDANALFLLDKAANHYPWTLKHFQSSLNMGYRGFKVIINQSNNTPILVGFILFMTVLNEAHLLNLAVHPKFQGLGYGKVLLKMMKTILIAENSQRIFLEVRASNYKAMQFYQSEGFEYISKRKNYYPMKNGREDAQIMCAEIA